jgi:hypothetical protein
MIDGKRLVCVTPAGRARYMRELIPFVLSEPLVDRYDIWVHTRNPGDLAFLESLKGIDRIRLVPQPSGRVDRTMTIYEFFGDACDPDTVYIRFDDDIVFVEQDAITKLARYRLANPEPFLVTPVVVNNAVITTLLQVHGRIPAEPQVQPDAFDGYGWYSHKFAQSLWRLFLDKVEAGRVSDFHVPDATLGFNRFSINCVSWLGETFAEFGGEVSWDEEFDLTVTRPVLRGESSTLFGGAVVGHFAFYKQRFHLDAAGLLAKISAANRKLTYVDAGLRDQIATLADAAAAQFPESRPRRMAKQVFDEAVRNLIWPKPIPW